MLNKIARVIASSFSIFLTFSILLTPLPAQAGLLAQNFAASTSNGKVTGDIVFFESGKTFVADFTLTDYPYNGATYMYFAVYTNSTVYATRRFSVLAGVTNLSITRSNERFDRDNGEIIKSVKPVVCFAADDVCSGNGPDLDNPFT